MIQKTELFTILKAYKWEFAFTLFLILLESAIIILFPLFIGYAIEDTINNSKSGVINLGILGFMFLIIGTGRRFFDSRVYAKIFQHIGSKIISQIDANLISIRTARLNMIKEVVEFMENTIPQLVSNLIGLVGVVFIIATLNKDVFWGTLFVTLIIFSIYWNSSKRTVSLNKATNDELEKRVEVLSTNDTLQLDNHLKEVMKYNIKLSSLETFNFCLSWLLLVTFLIFSIIISQTNGVVKYGALFSLITYVFQYMENVINLPLFYQNWLRLKDINERLANI